MAMLTGAITGWLSRNEMVITLLFAYVLMFLFPGDIMYQVLDSSPIIRFPFAALARLATTASLCSAVDTILSLSPNSWYFAILAGLLAATGGGITFDTFGLHSKSWSFHAPACLQRPGSRLGLPLLLSVLYSSTKMPLVKWGKALNLIANSCSCASSCSCTAWTQSDSISRVALFAVFISFDVWVISMEILNHWSNSSAKKSSAKAKPSKTSSSSTSSSSSKSSAAPIPDTPSRRSRRLRAKKDE